MTDLANKKVLILGGSRGIGAAIVRRFAKGGAVVTFTYAGSADAAAAIAGETGAAAVQTDSADRDALIATVRDAGALDAIVINAGTLVMGDPLTLDADAVDRMIDVNVRAPYHDAVPVGQERHSCGAATGSGWRAHTPTPGQFARRRPESARGRRPARSAV